MPPPALTRASSRTGSALRRRLGTASRTLAGLAGGYTVAALLATSVALAYRTPVRDEAIAAGTTPAFLAFAGCIVWAFAASSATRAWLGIGVPGALMALLVWRLQAG